jgi:membrane associated rhomboid family serine protease
MFLVGEAAVAPARSRPARRRSVFPLRDDNPTELFPIFTFGLILACVAVWLYVQGAGLSPPALGESICTLGAIPAEVTGAASVGGPCPPGGLTWQALITSMFLHGSWMHLIGNMWFLWIFGNNVEDSMGHVRFLVFFLLTGIAAALAHVLLNPTSAVPMVGASGAISAIMGAYVVLYPRARIHTLFFFVFFIRVIPLPAWLILGYWLLIQVASHASLPATGGGVAYAAHIGGFAAGVLLIFLFRNRKLVGAKRSGVVINRRDLDGGGWW